MGLQAPRRPNCYSAVSVRIALARPRTRRSQYLLGKAARHRADQDGRPSAALGPRSSEVHSAPLERGLASRGPPPVYPAVIPVPRRGSNLVSGVWNQVQEFSKKKLIEPVQKKNKKKPYLVRSATQVSYAGRGRSAPPPLRGPSVSGAAAEATLAHEPPARIEPGDRVSRRVLLEPR